MKTATILVIGLFCTETFAFAQTSLLQNEDAKLGIEFDAAWVSKYIWRGQDLYDDHAAFQPSLDFDLFGTGFSVNIWHSTSCGSGFVLSDELDYSATYQNSLFNNSKYKTQYQLTWLYYDYFRMSSDEVDSQELDLSLSWPDVFPFGLTPNYTLSYLYAAKSSSPASSLEMEGYAHTLGFTYDCNAPQTDLPLTFSWDITYNDGQCGMDVDHDWSHITWGLSTSLDIGPGSFTPAAYYQTSMDDSINNEDELWLALSYTLSF
ncbi:MAG: hypothetical protein JW787_11710 [Sedimentisphaerales bacterium]|nr:hypothetical protein [Sedimentisphaerales bacterium]